jgi:hypothetical protein
MKLAAHALQGLVEFYIEANCTHNNSVFILLDIIKLFLRGSVISNKPVSKVSVLVCKHMCYLSITY